MYDIGTQYILGECSKFIYCKCIIFSLLVGNYHIVMFVKILINKITFEEHAAQIKVFTLDVLHIQI